MNNLDDKLMEIMQRADEALEEYDGGKAMNELMALPRLVKALQACIRQRDSETNIIDTERIFNAELLAILEGEDG